MRHQQRVGHWGEKIAAEFLESQGCEIMDHNFRTPFGELDIVARKEDIYLFVEVKTRTSNTFGLPEQAVNEEKQTHLIQAAEAYLQSHPEIMNDWRIDVIAIQKLRGEPDPKIVWFENALH